eukprot:Ihof_evm3s108 gene=Ihof_evmTU3s108
MTTAGEPLMDTLDMMVMGTTIIGALGYFVATRRFGAKKPEIVAKKTATVIKSQSLSARMQAEGKDIVIFYGTQTGTAEDFANRLAKEAKLYGFSCLVIDIEDVDTDDIAELANHSAIISIFCVATYGEGDPTDNAIDFHQWLSEEADTLEGMKYAVFGLGNSSYDHYQAMGRLVDKRLAKLGAERVFKLGEGDDDKNIEDDFNHWKKKLLPALCKACGREIPDNIANAMPERQYKIEIHTGLDESAIFMGEVGRKRTAPVSKRFVPDMKNPQLVPVRVNRELFSDDAERSCRHVELDITDTNISYVAGDHLAVFPTNDASLVETLGKQLAVDLDTVFSLQAIDKNSSKKSPFPGPCSYRTALLHYVDINALPKPHQLRELSQYATGEDKERLVRMASEEDQEEYTQWVLSDMRTFSQILTDLPSLQLPIDHLLEMLPRLQCRYYSISSSPKAHPTSIHITAVVVEYDTPIGRHVKGIATNYLQNIPVNNSVPIYVRHSTFRLPRRIETPIIMIGPGTGVAPFRGFLQDRAADCAKEGKTLGSTVLYYGCRNRTQDYLYREELENYTQNGTCKLELAFSREQAEKVYVTHLVKRDKEAIWQTLNAGGHIYVC